MLQINQSNKEEQYFTHYLEPYINYIETLDIKNFNYLIFLEDLDNMHQVEFNTFFENEFKTIVKLINRHISFDISDLDDQPYRIKLLFAKNIVKFYMFDLPYNYLKNHIFATGCENMYDALKEFDEQDVKSKLIDQIHQMKRQYNNFNELINNLEDTISNDKKRDKFTDIIMLLDTNMDLKLKLLKYHVTLINNSEALKLVDLIKIYLDNDSYNII